MLSIRRSGSFDSESSALVAKVVQWALKRYGPTPSERRWLCSCPSCCVRRAEGDADRETFFTMIEARRSALLAPQLLFNETEGPYNITL